MTLFNYQFFLSEARKSKHSYPFKPFVVLLKTVYLCSQLQSLSFLMGKFIYTEFWKYRTRATAPSLLFPNDTQELQPCSWFYQFYNPRDTLCHQLTSVRYNETNFLGLRVFPIFPVLGYFLLNFLSSGASHIYIQEAPSLYQLFIRNSSQLLPLSLWFLKFLPSISLLNQFSGAHP